ncbi:hypothetical protein HYPDE_30583 [Hyphomicrobium denitrificans 1NES1]|uniref:Uncharacterized protein n=1 Tax=Hyphomicrobium denitrificans 1NES1 TaxID=670307 RepID=N0BB77_9HYPH|nr:hypothetical protein [Hyphomicrobium denitrificans]AGK57791.1 hypothetical protein HYPDE_30583 [Hyphomicrobium denitrificans 1NES1]
MRIILDHDDCPNADDRSVAERIIREIALNDVVTKGSLILEGYSVACRIAQALTAARRDERRRGFDTPFRMPPIKSAPGAPAVAARRPKLRPLYHWTTIEGVHFQSYKAGRGHPHLLISDDARIVLKAAGYGRNVSRKNRVGRHQPTPIGNLAEDSVSAMAIGSS